MRKTLLSVLVHFLFVFNFYSQTFEWAYGNGVSGGGPGYSKGCSIGTDALGNVYTIGNHSGGVDMDPTSGLNILFHPSSSNQNVFISKTDQHGHVLWVKELTNPNDLWAMAMYVDSAGNIYSTGYMPASGGLSGDFDPGPAVYPLQTYSSYDIYISKLDASGNFVWAKSIYGIGNDYAQAITLDNSGNIYLTGQFQNTVDFDPGPGTANLISFGMYDAFVMKLDNSGNFLWVKQMGGSNDDMGLTLATDATGSVYTAGRFLGTGDFNPDAGITNLTSLGSTDIFLTKLNSSGNFIWTKQIGGIDLDVVTGINIDNSGCLVMAGMFKNTVDFDPGAGIYNVTSSGTLLDIFILKLDSAFNFSWVKKIGNPSGVYGNFVKNIEVDIYNNIYTTGGFESVLDFDPGLGVYNLSGYGANDIFVWKLDSSGNFVTAMKMGGSQNDNPNEISVDMPGNIYTTGFYYGWAEFNPAEIYVTPNYSMNNSYYVSKISQNNCSNFKLAIDSVSNYPCSAATGFAYGHAFDGIRPYTYSWNTSPTTNDSSANFTSSGIFTLTVTDSIGCVNTSSVLIDASASLSNYDMKVNATVGGPFSGGLYITVLLDGFNDGCVFANGQLHYILDSNLLYLNALPLPDQISGDTLSWNYSGQYDDPHVSALVTVKLKSTVITGDTIAINAFITPLVGDFIPADNSITRKYIAYFPHDPNEKIVDPIGECIPGYIPNGQKLTYTVRFQNTGTAEAVNVFVLDTLSSSLDISTLHILSSSHNMITEVLYGNVIKFVFNNIHLPDSTASEPLSHGYFYFEIEPFPGLSFGTPINNGVGIYFDTQPVVITNNVLNTITDGTHYPLATITQSGSYLNLNIPIATSYQWLDCNDSNSVIPGATYNYLGPISNGSYAVVITKNGCIATSDCYTVLTTDLSSIVTENALTIFPNPNNGIFALSFEKEITNGSIRLYSMDGRLIAEKENLMGKNFNFNLPNLATGIYFAEINTEEKSQRIKICIGE